jgi:hypothetical protein
MMDDFSRIPIHRNSHAERCVLNKIYYFHPPKYSVVATTHGFRAYISENSNGMFKDSELR